METVVITASAGTFSGLAAALRTLPLTVEEFPLIGFRAPSDWVALDVALDRLSSYRAIALTSPRAAGVLAARIAGREIPAEGNESPPVWAAGATTASALQGAIGPVHTPAGENSSPEGAAAALAAAMIDARVGSPVLFPCGNSRRDELPGRLRREGIEVDEVVCYESVLASESAARAAAGRATILVVASPSVAQLLTRACPLPDRPDLIAAGPTTAASARASGWAPAAVAPSPTVEAVTTAVRAVIAARSPHE